MSGGGFNELAQAVVQQNPYMRPGSSNYGLGRFMGGYQQQPSTFRPQTYAAPQVGSLSGYLDRARTPQQPVMGWTDGGGNGVGTESGGLLGRDTGDVNIGPGLSNPFSREGRLENDLANLYGLNRATVTPGFFDVGGMGYAAPEGALLGMNDPAPGDYGGFGSGMTDGGPDASGGYGGGSSGSDGYGGADGPGGTSGIGGESNSGSDGGDGWAKGGKVTKKRLIGPNPKGPDDGYGALDEGEVVIPARVAKRTASKVVRKYARK